MAKLVIVESPAKAKTIGKYLGDDYEVTASMGHIRDLPASQLGIDVEHGYTPQYISITAGPWAWLIVGASISALTVLALRRRS